MKIDGFPKPSFILKSLINQHTVSNKSQNHIKSNPPEKSKTSVSFKKILSGIMNRICNIDYE
jgi:hypothetical protein